MLILKIYGCFRGEDSPKLPLGLGVGKKNEHPVLKVPEMVRVTFVANSPWISK